jgi:hypothetical protein
MTAGINPRTVALDLAGRINPATGFREGGLIGLTSTQEGWVRNYARDLDELSGNALTRALRDKRFDLTVAKAIREGTPIPADAKAAMIRAYKNRALRFRAEGIARTEAMAALHEAQRHALDQAIASGALRADAITMKWRSARDARVRDTHAELDGQVVKYGESFQSSLGPIRYPGDPAATAANTINCRCTVSPIVDFLRDVV